MMRTINIFIFGLLFFVVNCSDTNQEKQSQNKLKRDGVFMEDSIELIGSLVEVPAPAQRCGDDAIAVVYKFQIINVLNGSLENGVVLISIPCPELKGDRFFIKDEKYNISATSDLSEADVYTVINQYSDENLPLIWARVVEKVDE